MSKAGVSPADLKNAINATHRNPLDQNAITQALQTSMMFLHQSVKDHSLEDEDCKLAYLEMMRLFAYPPSNKGALFLKKKLSDQFTCSKCLAEYNAIKRKLFRVFKEVYKYDAKTMSTFRQGIDTWEKERTIEVLKGSNEYATRCALVDLLKRPKHLEDRAVFECFEKTLQYFIDDKNLVSQIEDTQSIATSVYILLFATVSKCRIWARNKVKSVSNITVELYDDDLGAIFSKLWNKSTNTTSYWHSLNIFLNKCSDEVLLKRICVDSGILPLIIQHLKDSDHHLVAVLSCLKTIPFGRLSETGMISNLDGYNPRLVLETIFGNNTFQKYLEQPSLAEKSTVKLGEMSLVSWIQPFLEQDTEHGQLCALTLSLAHQLSKQIKISSHFALEIYRTCTNQLLRTASMKGSDESKSFVRSILSAYSKDVSTLAMNILSTENNQKFTDIQKKTLWDMIQTIIELDSELIYDYYKNNLVAATKQEFTGVDVGYLWSPVAEAVTNDNLMALGRLMGGIRPLSCCASLENNALFNMVFEHAEILQKTLLRRIKTLRNSSCRTLLLLESCAHSILCHFFSPRNETYEETLETLCHMFDCYSRFDALKMLAQFKFNTFLGGLNRGLAAHNSSLNFSAATRIVKLLIDVQKVIVDISREFTSPIINLDILKSFWKFHWRTLASYVAKSITWSLTQRNDVMTNYMRNVLDCAKGLYRNLKIFEKWIIEGKDNNSANLISEKTIARKVLVENCEGFVKALVSWLRLTDEYLLQSSVDMICDIINTCSKAKVSLDMKIIQDIETLAKGTKKSKLKDDQKVRLVQATSLHTTQDDVDDGYISENDVVIVDKKKPSLAHMTTKTTEKTSQPVSQKASKIGGLKSSSNAINQLKSDFLRSRHQITTSKPVRKVHNISDESEESDSDALLEIARDHEKKIAEKKERKQTKMFTNEMTSIQSKELNLQNARLNEKLRKAKERARVMRMKPDLTPLLRQILEWSPSHNESTPPGNVASYAYVKPKYDAIGDYIRTFEPLLLMECWEQILQTREENKIDSISVRLHSRQLVDRFIDVLVNVKVTEATENLREWDILQLQLPEPAFAKVQGIVRKGNTFDFTLRFADRSEISQRLKPNVSFDACKVTSLVTVNREYAALVSLEHYDLCSQILKAQITPMKTVQLQEKLALMKLTGVNEPQAEAILGCADNQGFNLIQGPPGTGKTKTILGIVANLLQSRTGLAQSSNVAGIQLDKKILLCAPSNAAVDELAVRLKGGLIGSDGKLFKPSVVRIGVNDAMNVNVKELCLDDLVEKALSTTKNGDDDVLKANSTKDTDLRSSMEALLIDRDTKRIELENLQAELNQNPQDQNTRTKCQTLETELAGINQRKLRLGRQLDEVRDKKTEASRNSDFRKKQVQDAVLKGAHIICATLSGSGHEMLGSLGLDFQTVIIDEAAQSIELSALIPLKYGALQCIMVGDPNQLPPTVISKAATQYAYNQSLFVRMQQSRPEFITLLTYQYRMHPDISQFPSNEFYKSKLLDGPEMAAKTERLWHKSTLYTPYRFFNIYTGREETGRSHSFYNKEEAIFASTLCRRLRQDFPEIDFTGRIGIITPYKQQLKQLKQTFFREFGQEISRSIDFNTVDGFQGQEKDIIIFSCVRADDDKGVGFLADVRRMNVALTRAKSSLFILGNADVLRKNSIWRALIENARDRKCFTQNHKSLLRDSSRLHPLPSKDESTSKGEKKNGESRTQKVLDKVSAKGLPGNTEKDRRNGYQDNEKARGSGSNNSELKYSRFVVAKDEIKNEKELANDMEDASTDDVKNDKEESKDRKKDIMIKEIKTGKVPANSVSSGTSIHVNNGVKRKRNSLFIPKKK